jgi:hypothetical protein
MQKSYHSICFFFTKSRRILVIIAKNKSHSIDPGFCTIFLDNLAGRFTITEELKMRQIIAENW